MVDKFVRSFLYKTIVTESNKHFLALKGLLPELGLSRMNIPYLVLSNSKQTTFLYKSFAIEYSFQLGQVSVIAECS